MRIDRLSSSEKISAGSSVLVLIFMFFRWYGLEVDERPSLLFDLRLSEDGGNAWQTLEVTPIILTLITVVLAGVALRRILSRAWCSPVALGPFVCGLGVLAVCLILMRIVFPPNLGGEVEGFTFTATLEPGIFLALVAACGIVFGGRLAMQEEGVSFADLRWIRFSKFDS